MKPALCILFATGILPALLLTACAPTGKDGSLRDKTRNRSCGGQRQSQSN